MVKFGGDTSGLGVAMRSLSSEARKLGDSLKGYFSGIAGNIASVLSVAGVISAGRAIVDYGAKLQDMAETTKVSTDFLQGFQSAVANNAGTIEGAGKGLEKLSVLIGRAREGNKEAIAVFERYGIALKNANGEASKTEDILFRISDRMKEGRDSTEKISMSAALFGDKLGAKLVPALESGSEALKAFIEQSKKLTSEDIAALDAISDNWDQFVRNVKTEGGIVLGFWSSLADRLEKVAGFKPNISGMESMRQIMEALAVITTPGNTNTPAPSPTPSSQVPGEPNYVEQNKTALEKQLAELKKITGKILGDNLSKEKAILAEKLKQLKVTEEDNRKRSDFGKLTVGDLADRGNGAAQRAQNLKSRIQDAEANGNSKLAASLRNQYLQTVQGISGLNSSEKAPFVQDPFDKAMQDAINQTGRIGHRGDFQRDVAGRSRIRELENIGRDKFNEDILKRQADSIESSKAAVETLAGAVKGGKVQVDVAESKE